ncbi:hypothetical protein BCIN_16g04470 [Botrytis cinerea B05.10]|uniref:Uncharacterized protein n=1 Tax=Botryotinia fuckeliana (strain B05.10) TaxID=332648 RepID=A0A384K7W4_BOTFB|nr:hypothetical protein BCIN_16g04470 [Botrytis cinerea B05.10]
MSEETSALSALVGVSFLQ